MSRRFLRRLGILLLLAAAAVGLKFTVLRADPVPVTVFRVAAGRVEDTVTNSRAGTVRSRKRAALSPEVGGRVAELLVQKGDRVRAGQVLLRLADEDRKAQLALQERALEAARAAEAEACRAAEQAERELGRYANLAASELVSQELLDQLRSRRDIAASSCEAARARALQARSALELARVELSKTVLRAPFDGIVADVRTEVGEWITPAPPAVPVPAVVEILDPDSIYVSAPLDEAEAARVREGLPARVSLDARPGESFMGKVTRVAPYVTDIERQSRTLDIEVTLDDPAAARTLVPGSSADVEVILDEREGVLRVPSYAIMEGSRVLVLRNGRLASVQVETGLKNWDFTEIRAGLASGDLVVVSLDRAEVREGARARVEKTTER
jgi:HlyD family secretion protein